jgi:hypothetical protein
LEGLEINEVNYSEAITNKDFRTDSDFWTKASKPNVKLKYAPIGDVLLKSQYGISIEMNELDNGYPIYRMNEIHNMVCDFEVDKCADISADEFKIFELNDRDVLFNRTNSYEWVGRTGVFKKQVGKDFVFASYLVRFVPDQQIILPEYLASFLSSKYGVCEIRRRARHSINQTNVNPEEVKAIRIPLLNFEIQNAIQSHFDSAVDKLLQSQHLYAEAETLLLDTLGMADFSPNTEGINIKSFKDSFGATGRLDAEAYQPKYDQLRGILECYAGGVTTIDELAGQIANGAEVREYQEAGVAYLRVGDLKGLTIDAASVVRIDPASAEKGLEKIDLQAGDVLVSRSGSLAVTAVVEPEWADALISSHLIRLRITDARIDPYYLALFLGAVPGKMQIQQRSNGGVQPEINQPALKSILVPIPPQKDQQEIRRLILSARKLREASQNLLDVAKRAVEIAIEQDENAGMAYIEANS